MRKKCCNGLWWLRAVGRGEMARVWQSVPGLKEAGVAGAARGTCKGKSRLANSVATQRL